MSVLIKGMEMPKNCEDCDLCYDMFMCIVTRQEMDFETMDKERQPDCPLIPLPSEHGRLIDADALIDTLGISDRDIYCKCVIEEDAPTIIEAEGSDT